MKLVLWEKKEMAVRVKDEQTGEWVKTKDIEEKTLYTLRDEFGDVLKFLAGNEYRDYEGGMVTLTLKIEYNEYQNKNVVKLESIDRIDS